jgi:hypothetical protein
MVGTGMGNGRPKPNPKWTPPAWETDAAPTRTAAKSNFFIQHYDDTTGKTFMQEKAFQVFFM